MNKRQAKKRFKKLNTSKYMIITSSKRDRGHRIPKQKAVLATMGIGKSGVLNHNHRFYPYDTVIEAMKYVPEITLTPSMEETLALHPTAEPTFSIRGIK